MHTYIHNHLRVIMLLIACSFQSPVFASHIVGAGFTYRYLGDTLVSGQTLRIYEVSMEIYQDCVTGAPEAINEDNPAFFTIYDRSSSFYIKSDSVSYSPVHGAATIPATITMSPCGNVSLEGMPQLCLLKKTFKKTFFLPANTSGYWVVYQRCCRNSSILNIVDPGNIGISVTCTIPPAATPNSSAVFTNYPPQAICNNRPMTFDHSATDADGDSLSYELCNIYNGASNTDIKPFIATPPPYVPINFLPPYTYEYPMSGSDHLKIDPVTGKMTVTPNRIGRYLISVQCKEWRNGTLINSIQREFEWVVAECTELANNYRPYAGKNKTVIVGNTVQFDASGAARYLWIPNDFLDDPNIANPVGHFTKTGEYTYILLGESDSGCTGNDTLKVTVLPHSDFAIPNAFTPNNDGRNDQLAPIPIGTSVIKAFRVFNRWGNLLFTGGTSIGWLSSNLGWDGTYKGKMQDQGTYFWQIEYIDNTGAPRTKSGNVILLR